MFVFGKKNRKESSRRQIALKSVIDGVMELPGGEFRLILETSSINFHLMSELEQDAVVDTYKAFLNSLSFPIQILQRVRSLDLDDYTARFEKQKEAEASEVYRHQIDGYIRYVSNLVKSNRILSRRFYIVIPYTVQKKRTDDPKEQLRSRAALVEKGLANIGVKSRQLPSLELLDLFYSSFSPADAKLQPLSERTASLLKGSYL